MIRATLLHYANSSPPVVGRTEFYALKSRLLKQHGTRDGEDVQHIVAPCWGYYDQSGCEGAECTKCGGTGIFHETFVRLLRYRWGRYSFHTPIERSYTSCFGQWPTIKGRVEHRRYGRVTSEAVLWLYLLCGEWRLLARALKSSAACGRYFWPLLNVQRAIFRLRLYTNRRRCWCGRSFWTLGSGWQICAACRHRPVEVSDDLPF